MALYNDLNNIFDLNDLNSQDFDIDYFLRKFIDIAEIDKIKKINEIEKKQEQKQYKKEQLEQIYSYTPFNNLFIFIEYATLQEKKLLKYTLSNYEIITCVFWEDNYYITGTDIVKILTYIFRSIGYKIHNLNQHIFSDLRQLKIGEKSILLEPKSEFLDYLYMNNCLKTQKKQKVFLWNCVNYDLLIKKTLDRYN